MSATLKKQVRSLEREIIALGRRIKEADEVLSEKYAFSYSLAPSHSLLGKLRILLRGE